MFELYDRDKNRNTFLGLGIVGMEELLMNPSQRQIIPLQSRPYENDCVSGTLTVEVITFQSTSMCLFFLTIGFKSSFFLLMEWMYPTVCLPV
jgi:hypothetical protein